MEVLISVLRKFLTRDLTYLVGGGAVLLAFLHMYDKVDRVPSTGILVAFPIVLAYVTGYSIQEIFTLLHFTRTRANVKKANCYAKWLFRVFERKPSNWEPNRSDEYEEAKEWLYRKGTPQRRRDDHERREFLKQVGTTLGPCFLITALILFLPLLGVCTTWRMQFWTAVPILMAIIGFVLLSLGWLKVIQQREYLLEQYSRHSKRHGKSDALMNWIHPYLEIRESGHYGKSVYANSCIPAGTKLAVFGGYVMRITDEPSLANYGADFALLIDEEFVIGADGEMDMDDAPVVSG